MTKTTIHRRRAEAVLRAGCPDRPSENRVQAATESAAPSMRFVRVQKNTHVEAPRVILVQHNTEVAMPRVVLQQKNTHVEMPPLQFVCATCGGPVDRTGQTQHDCPGPARDAIQSSFRTASPQCEQPVPPPVAPEHLTEVGRRVRVPK